jgi:hypothetical protein
MGGDLDLEVMGKNAILQHSSIPMLPSVERFQYQRVHTVFVDNGYSVYFGHLRFGLKN